MDDSVEEFEPLFDYHRVQPFSIIPIDDDPLDSPVVGLTKTQKLPETSVEKKDEKIDVVQLDEDEDEDWLPPPLITTNYATKFSEDSIIKQLRLKRQELASLAQSGKDILRNVEESVKRDIADAESRKSALNASSQSALSDDKEHRAKPSHERAKIVLSIQNKEETKKFRVYMDDQFEKIFEMYAEKVKVDSQKLIFRFDGNRISPSATPGDLGMEDDDMVEVDVKAS